LDSMELRGSSSAKRDASKYRMYFMGSDVTQNFGWVTKQK
jgi:hypothetical protein